MPRAKPKTERTCLVCTTVFMGTPKATRCDTCRSSGQKLPREHQQARRRKPLPRKEAKPLAQLVVKQCGACGEDHQTHKPKATRCQPCIDANKRVVTRRCLSCNKQFPDPHDVNYNCEPCAKALDIDQCQMTPEQIEALEEAERLERFLEKRDRQLEWLTARDKRRLKLP